MVIEFIANWSDAVWEMMLSSSFLLIIGIFFAGLISVFFNSDKIKKYLKGGGVSQVFKAALFGIPLPLCSCSVLPVAHQLRKSGVKKGGTVSFLISTPETGIDSIMLTYSLIDPVMTVARPLSAFITASAAGLVENAFDDGSDDNLVPPEEPSCGCSSKISASPEKTENSIIKKTLGGIKYAFSDLLSDLSPYLLLGYVLAGLVTVLLGEELLSVSSSIQSGFGGYMIALLFGIPLYICATASTPLAASLLVGGFSPGAVLVFMLAGPATNVASLVVVSKIIGPKAVFRYLFVIILFSVLSGLTVDYVYESFSFSTNFSNIIAHEHSSILDTASATFISALILLYSLRTLSKKLYKK